MSGDLAVSLALKLNDQGSGPATQALNKVKQSMKEVGEAAKSSSAAAVSAFQKLATSREILGIRSEKAIQNEIRQTEAAYKRMADAGIAGARELGRAQDAMKSKVAALRQEMEGVKTSAGGMHKAVGVAMGVAGAYQAGKMVLSGPVKQTMGYSMELAHASNTMFAGQSVAARIAAKGQINDAVMEGVRAAKGGVTREDALAGVKTIGASGVFGDDPRAAFNMLPILTKAAAANDSNVTDMANIAIKAKQTMGLTNTSRVLDMAAQGGIEGQFELRDMAKWLPQQMAYSKRTGLRGESGFATLVAANQIAMNTAGSTDEAGNNVKNLLSKVNSTDTANDAKKLKIDLSGSLAAAQAKGVGGLDAFLNLTDQVAAKDSRLVKLREQAKGAKGDDLRANLAAQAGILEGSAIGKIVQDQQAMSALVALLNGRQKFNEIRDKTLTANGTNDDLLKVIADEPGAKAQLAAAEAANNMQTALSKVNPLLGAAADVFSKLSQDFPVLAAAVTGSALATTALAASATAASVALMMVAGAGGAGGGLPGAAGKALGFAGKATGVLGAFGAGYGIGSFLNDGINKGTQFMTGDPTQSLGGLVYDMTHGDELKKNNSTMPSGGGMNFQNSQQPLRIENKLIVDGRQIAEATNTVNARTASRH